MCQVLKLRIVKFDVDAETPIRGPNGFCFLDAVSSATSLAELLKCLC